MGKGTAVTVRLKRIYEAKADDDGLRILVDRLWPRGIRKEDADIDLWLKDVAPSQDLRKWFGHDPARWEEFRQRYRDEILRDPAAFEHLREQCRGRTVTLLYGAKDTEHNQAVVLRDLLSKR